MPVTQDLPPAHASPWELRAAAVAARIRSTAATVSTGPQLQLLDVCLPVLVDPPDRGCVVVPLLVTDMLRGDPYAGVSVAAACACIWLGANIIDDVVDGTASAFQDQVGETAALLTAATLLSSTSYCCLADIDLPGDLMTACARALCVMAGGQLAGTSAGPERTSLEDALEEATAKAGAEVALFAELAARSAGAGPAVVSACAAFGRALGIAGQLASDVGDIARGRDSDDLRNGLHTYPVAAAIHRLPASQADELATLLACSHHDPQARERAAALIVQGGGIHVTALKVQLVLTQAQRALASMGASGPAYDELIRLCSSTSLLHRKEGER